MKNKKKIVKVCGYLMLMMPIFAWNYTKECYRKSVKKATLADGTPSLRNSKGSDNH